MEGLIRLSSAHARAKFQDEITGDDALVAISLVTEMYRSVGTDPSTGQVDPGILYGKPLSERGKLETSSEIFDELEKSSKDNLVDKDEFIQKLIDSGKFNASEARKYFRNMSDSGQIYNVKDNFYRKVR